MITMEVFTFDAEVSSHALLQQGVTAAKLGSQHRHHRVVIAAESHEQARGDLVDLLMVQGYMVTRIEDRI